MRFLLSFALTCFLQAQPVVTKVEPPNWWAGHSLNPVRLMIRGAGLTGARAVATDKGIEVGPSSVNPAGTYLFVDVKVSQPGSHPLRIVSATGSVTVPFEVLPPVARAGRFAGFSSDDLIYLIMPDRFANGDPANDDPPISRGLFDRGKPRYYHGGDLRGILEHLPYLKDLGVTALWINPVYDNVNHLNRKEIYDNQPITDYHGYGAVDFYGVEEHLGDLETLRRLVDAAHASGLKVILDMVENHTGPYHPWVEDPPTPAWYHGTPASHVKESWQTWTLIDPHAPAAFQRSTLDGWFVDILPDLNQDDRECARYLIQNTLWWIASAGLDGIRQDTLPYVPRTFWRDWMAAIKREYPGFRVVGEMFDGDPALVSFFQGGKARFDGVDSGVDSLFDFPLYYSVRRVFAEHASMSELPKTLGHDEMYVDPNALVTFLGLHDVARFMNVPGASIEGLKLAFTFLCTTRGIPMIYYGDEIAMHGGEDPDNRRDFPGGWPNDSRNAFSAMGRTREETAVFAHIRKLAHLRQEVPDLRHGALRELASTDTIYAFTRGSTIVALNNGQATETIVIDAPPGEYADRLNNGKTVGASGGRILVELPAFTAAVLVKRP